MRKATLTLAALLSILALPTPRSQAQTLTVLHYFDGTDGAYPQAGLVMDKAGNLYGTTVNGGSFGCADGCGVVLKLDTTVKETVLHSFTNAPDGASPYSSLVMDKEGNLYGTTTSGGSSGYGIVFKVDTTGKETVIYSFSGGTDGANPSGGMVMDKAGNLYGTTGSGGSSGCGVGCGVVFKLDTTGKETVLYNFTNTPDGAGPTGGLVRDKAGNLYGTTSQGGDSSGCGTVFKVDTTGNETVLHRFTNCYTNSDGGDPYARVLMDKAGNLYGTTVNGGSSGYGTVFKVDTSGNETLLHSFSGNPSDGLYPYGGLVLDKAGNLYGTTAFGGSAYGTVFKLDTTGKETVLHIFTDSDVAKEPYTGLVRDKAGNLYGTTLIGGSGYGTVFRLSP